MFDGSSSCRPPPWTANEWFPNNLLPAHYLLTVHISYFPAVPTFSSTWTKVLGKLQTVEGVDHVLTSPYRVHLVPPCPEQPSLFSCHVTLLAQTLAYTASHGLVWQKLKHHNLPRVPQNMEQASNLQSPSALFHYLNKKHLSLSVILKWVVRRCFISVFFAFSVSLLLMPMQQAKSSIYVILFHIVWGGRRLTFYSIYLSILN